MSNARMCSVTVTFVDEPLRDQLEKHLVGLRRKGVIPSWYERRITAGTELDEAVVGTADVISYS